MIAALGVGSRPILTRVFSRKAVCMRFQVPVVAPGTEITPDRRPRGKVVRQGPPLASGAIHVEERVENLTHVRRARMPACFGRRDQRFQDRPFLLGEIAGVAAR